MTNNEQIIAIAELCGAYWTITREGYGYPVHILVMPGYSPPESWDDSPGIYPKTEPRLIAYNVPTYTTNRDAMTEALRQLDDDEWLEYMMRLLDIRHTLGTAGKWTTARALLESTPAQQVEAFLKVKGKWVEG